LDIPFVEGTDHTQTGVRSCFRAGAGVIQDGVLESRTSHTECFEEIGKFVRNKEELKPRDKWRNNASIELLESPRAHLV
jgi:hypothetical protein